VEPDPVTAADLVRALADHGVTVSVLADLCLAGSAPPPPDLVADLRDRKGEVVAHLLGLDLDAYAIDPAAVTAKFRLGNGSRPSFLLALGLLARRLAHTTDPAVKARLERLFRFTPVTPRDYTAFDQRMDEVLAALEAEGKLPPV
jgi:hypothetical protein